MAYSLIVYSTDEIGKPEQKLRPLLQFIVDSTFFMLSTHVSLFPPIFPLFSFFGGGKQPPSPNVPLPLLSTPSTPFHTNSYFLNLYESFFVTKKIQTKQKLNKVERKKVEQNQTKQKQNKHKTTPHTKPNHTKPKPKKPNKQTKKNTINGILFNLLTMLFIEFIYIILSYNHKSNLQQHNFKAMW